MKAKEILSELFDPKKALPYKWENAQRARAALPDGRDSIKAWVPVESVTESKIIHRDGVDIEYRVDRDIFGLERLYVTALAQGQKLGSVNFVHDDRKNTWFADELNVDERYRGQGIAKIMYDVARAQLGKISASDTQTDAGKSFWAKHRPGQKVWEGK